MTIHESHDRHPHDLLAIGCGPFNLGLAALASTVEDVRFIALDAADEIRWHPGLMFDDAILQVSFLADLVTLVEPTHPLSFLAYLRDVDRLYPFYVRETFHITRREYELYLRWAAGKLSSLRFGRRVESVRWDADSECFHVQARRANGMGERFRAKHIVVGIGTTGFVPACLDDLPAERVIHSGQYLHRLDDLQRASHISVVGSGQSGAEIVLDLLRRDFRRPPRISWLTRTESFAPLDYTKLVLEMTTPEYVRYFHGLSEAKRDELVRTQWRHYKAISSETLAEIYELLYRRSLEPAAGEVELRCGVAVESSSYRDGKVRLSCRQSDTGATFEHATDLAIAATGYRPRRPDFLAPIAARLRTDQRGRPQIRPDHSIETEPEMSGRIFVANADLHSHGVAAPDLGLCAVRNATILNHVAGRSAYPLPQRTAFTSFGLPQDASPPSQADGADRTRSHFFDNRSVELGGAP